MALIVATTAAAQMMPSGVVKGGTAMQLRLGPGRSRFSQDLDVARAGALDEFEAGYRKNLRTGWAGFSGELVAKTPPSPVGVPARYVMRPCQVRVTYGTGGTPWRTVEFELGHDELGCTDAPEIEIAADVIGIFVRIGLPTPAALPLMARHHQVVQKLHACTAPGNDRARDLVDLQLLLDPDTLDYANTARLARRLFTARQGHAWPPRVVEQPGWASIYREAATDLSVATSLDAAIEWTNALIDRVAGY